MGTILKKFTMFTILKMFMVIRQAGGRCGRWKGDRKKVLRDDEECGKINREET